VEKPPPARLHGDAVGREIAATLPAERETSPRGPNPRRKGSGFPTQNRLAVIFPAAEDRRGWFSRRLTEKPEGPDSRREVRSGPRGTWELWPGKTLIALVGFPGATGADLWSACA